MKRGPGGPALEMLAALAPREVLQRAAELARNMERNEKVRRYLQARAVLIAGVGVAALVVGMMPVGASLGLWSEEIRALPGWLQGTVYIAALLAWLGFVLGAMFLLLSRLEREALAEDRALNLFSDEPPTGS